MAMIKTNVDPSETVFQMRINPSVRARVESVYADCGLTLAEAITLFFQKSLSVEGLPFSVGVNATAARFEKSVGRLMGEIDEGVASAARNGWIGESEIASEFGLSSC